MEHSKELLLSLHKTLLEARLLEAKIIDVYALGIVPGHIHSGMGQEGSYTGVLATRKPGDYFKLTHRPAAACTMVGTSLEVFFAELIAKKTGNSGGRGGILHIGQLKHGILGMSGTLGSDAAVPVGAALTIQMEERDNVAYMFIGDGAANRGPLYEAMNLAADWKLPVVFICENNGFAISTPTTYSSPVPNVLADKAVGYGMPSVVVDGTDVVAVYEAASKMVEYTRAGNGPSVIECKSYRWRGHFEGDQCAYRDGSVAEKYMAEKDCLKNFQQRLMAQGLLTQAEIDAMTADYNAAMDAALAKAQAAPEITAAEIYDNIYAE